MTDQTIVLIALMLVWIVGLFFVPRLGRMLKRAREEQTVKPPTYNLGDPMMREQLRNLLEHYNIVGDCDIRDGKVYSARAPGTRDAMAAALMGVYRGAVDRTQNPNLALTYHYKGILFTLGLDLSDIRDIAQLLEDAHGR